jgi:hypothetical protein
MNNPRCPVLAGHIWHSPEKEQSLGGALEEVIEVDEEQIVAQPDDSHATMPYYSPRESRSHGSTSVGDASSAAHDEPHTDVARKTPQTTSVSYIGGGDRSGPVPGHASPLYEHSGV